MLHHGDLFDVLPTLPAESLDACVTDPPYGLEFMGKDWDKLSLRDVHGNPLRSLDDPLATRLGKERGGGDPFIGKGIRYKAGREAQEWHERWAHEVYRVLKPGGYLLAFGGTRTAHRLFCGIEDAGFEIRDTVAWMYGSGFPKSLDVSKAIDEAAGATRAVVGQHERDNYRKSRAGFRNDETKSLENRGPIDLTVPATDAAKQWAGWGTALKPAHEPIVLARKPLTGTVAQNVLTHGTGALNIAGCRINPGDPVGTGGNGMASHGGRYGSGEYSGTRPLSVPHDMGRWPANVILGHSPDCEEGRCAPECAAALLDAQTGELLGGARETPRSSSGDGWGFETGPRPTYADSGGGSRFFYCSKPSREERNAGGVRNTHPTTKPVDLMRWLVRLVTPPNGTCLDPFAGSGTTGMACKWEGCAFVGIEREAEYVAIAERRIASVLPLFDLL